MSSNELERLIADQERDAASGHHSYEISLDALGGLVDVPDGAVRPWEGTMFVGRRGPKFNSGRKRPTYTCGSYSKYTNRGCRCDECREAARLYAEQKRRKAGVRKRAEPEHGTVTMYTKRGCRCSDCRIAASAAMRAYRAARKLRTAS